MCRRMPLPVVWQLIVILCVPVSDSLSCFYAASFDWSGYTIMLSFDQPVHFDLRVCRVFSVGRVGHLSSRLCPLAVLEEDELAESLSALSSWHTNVAEFIGVSGFLIGQLSYLPVDTLSYFALYSYLSYLYICQHQCYVLPFEYLTSLCKASVQTSLSISMPNQMHDITNIFRLCGCLARIHFHLFATSLSLFNHHIVVIAAR